MASSAESLSKRRRPQELSFPDGRRVLAVHPEDLDKYRQKYGNRDEIQVELVVRGSEHHLEFLRQFKTHHERRKSQLHELHGPAFEEWEEVHNQLNSVTTELDRLAERTSGLNANFSKFGFDALLRTYDEGKPCRLFTSVYFRLRLREGSDGRR